MKEATTENIDGKEASVQKGELPAASGGKAPEVDRVVDDSKESGNEKAKAQLAASRSCTLSSLLEMGVLFPLDLCRVMVVGNCDRCRKVGRMGSNCVNCRCPIVPYTTAARPHSSRHIYNPFVVARVFGGGLDRAGDPSAFTLTCAPARAVVSQRRHVIGVDEMGLYGIVSRSGYRKSPYRFPLMWLNEEEYDKLEDEGGGRVMELLERVLSGDERVPQQWEMRLEEFEKETMARECKGDTLRDS